jgi:hypothetical protein
MPTLSDVVVHGATTSTNHYRYQFTPKHHGADRDAAQWLPELSLEGEFAVFDSADQHALSDEEGWLYGVQVEGDSLRDLGTWTQQMAEFPSARPGEAWHGYPIWSVNELAPPNRRGQKMRPDKEVFLKMQRTGLLSERLRKRLFKGDHV